MLGRHSTWKLQAAPANAVAIRGPTVRNKSATTSANVVERQKALSASPLVIEELSLISENLDGPPNAWVASSPGRCPGGQAGTSSLIRNYLGFRHGVSGEELAGRASEQAWLFGADIVLAQRGTKLEPRGDDRIVYTSDGSAVAARAVVLATGVTWRRLDIPTLEALVGAGVFYGAAGAEAQAMRGRDVVVVGGGNSAGQAAVHLARYARSVTMLVRGGGLAATMSKYLITEIASNSAITVRARTEIVDGGGSGGLETLTVVDRTTGRATTIPATALFVLIGAQPHTSWLAGTVARAIPMATCLPASAQRPSMPRPPGRSSGRQCSSRPVSPESSPLVTCGLGQSKGWQRRWAKVPPPSA